MEWINDGLIYVFTYKLNKQNGDLANQKMPVFHHNILIGM